MSKYWTHYIKLPSLQAQCNLCQKVIKTGGSTTNLRNHLRYKHKEHLDLLDYDMVDQNLLDDSEIHDIQIPITEENDDMVIESSGDGASRSRSISPARSDSTSTGEDDVEDDDPASWEKGGSRDKKLTNHLLYMICIDNKPHVMVEGPAFVDLCKALKPLYRLPSGDEVLEMIAFRCEAIKSKIVTELREVEHVSLSCRKFTIEDRNFLAVTAHFICHVKEKPRKLFLGVRWLEPIITVEDGSSAFLSILNDFELPSAKIVSVCHDTSDILKMIVEQLFGEGKSVPCVARLLHSILSDGFDDECNPIMMSLINEVETAMEYVDQVYAPLLNRSLLTEEEAEDIVDVLEYMDDVSPKTDANSTRYIMRNFLRLRPCLVKALENGKIEGVPKALTNPDVNLLTEVIQVLAVFEAVTNELSADQYLTGSVIAPVISCIKTCLRDLSLSYSATKQFRETLTRSLEARAQPYLMSPLLCRASFCDPRFKKMYVPSGGVESAIEECCAEMKHIIEKSNSIIEESENVTALWRAHDESMANQKKTDGQIPYEVQVYLEQMPLPRTADPYQFWLRSRGCMPSLSRVALKNLTVCGSSLSMDKSEKVLKGIFSGENFCRTEEHIMERLFLNQLDKEYWKESSEDFD